MRHKRKQVSILILIVLLQEYFRANALTINDVSGDGGWFVDETAVLIVLILLLFAHLIFFQRWSWWLCFGGTSIVLIVALKDDLMIGIINLHRDYLRDTRLLLSIAGTLLSSMLVCIAILFLRPEGNGKLNG